MGAEGIEVQQGGLLRDFGTLPFQQMALADFEAIEDAENRIDGKVGLMRKERSFDDCQIEIAAGFAPTLCVSPPPRHEAVEKLKEQWEDEG